MTPAQRVQKILDEAVGSDLSSKEKFEFLPSMKERTSLTAGQEKWLHDIEKRVFGGDEE